MLLSWTRNSNRQRAQSLLKIQARGGRTQAIIDAMELCPQLGRFITREGSLGDFHDEYRNDVRRMDSTLPQIGSPGA